MSHYTHKQIRGYELHERIGAGGFGEVYRAWQAAVDREVAIKVILPEYANHPEFVDRFEAEARMVARLEHPHIVPLYDYWHDSQGAFLVMRYLSGGSLRDHLEAEGALRPEAIAPRFEQVCEALQAAHEAGVVHRDLKPENILLDERGQAYLSDFGIAKDLGGAKLTRTGALLGSAAYMSPEQAKGEKVSPQTDIYGLGIVLYELLTGEHPFPVLDPIQQIQRHISQTLPSISGKVPDIPAGLDGLIQKATAKIPAHRFASVAEMNAAFQKLLGEERPPAQATAVVKLPRFLETAEQAPPAPTFVGRKTELQQLESRLQSAIEGQGSILFLVGGAGRGKTALAQASARRALETHPNLLVAYGESNAQSGIGDPYLPFREALDMLAGGVESAWSTGKVSTEGATRLWSELPWVVQALLEFGPDLVDLMIPGSSLQARAAATDEADWASELDRFLEHKAMFLATSSVKQLDLFEQFTRVLRSLAERSPLLLILDDFQWADDASISLLFHLARRIADRPILLLCAYRPDEVALGREGDRHPLEQVVNELKRVYGEVTLDLSGTETLEGMDFIQAFLDSEPNQLGDDFRQALYEHTGGHPLFTVELLRAMQGRGDLIKNEEGYWVQSEDLAWDQLPARVEAVIEERIARLEEEIRELLTVASVEGNDFTVQVLAQIQNVEVRKLLRELSQELGKRHRLVRELGEVEAGRQILSKFQFAHHLFQRYLYNGLSAAERRLLHGEITTVLEEIFGEETDRVAVQLAYHSQRAHAHEKAIRYLRIAGDQAKASYANQEAVRYYTELLELLPRDGTERFAVLAARASVYDVVANRQAQLADAEEMLANAKAQGDEALQIDALLAVADAHIESEHVLAQEPAEKALDLARELGDPVREAGALRRLGWCAWLKNEYALSREYLNSAVVFFSQTDRQTEAANCLHILSLALGAMHDYQAAMETAREAVELSRQIGDPRLVATSLRRLAIAHINRDEYTDALPIANQALRLHREVGDWSEEAHALNVLAIIYGWLERWEESDAAFRESLKIGHELRSTTAILFATWNRATSHYWRQGRYEDAVRFLEKEIKKAMAVEDDWLIGALHFNKGIFLSEMGQHRVALDTLQIAESTFGRLSRHGPPHVNVLAWIGLQHAVMGSRRQAEEFADRAMELVDQLPNPADRVWPAANNVHTALLLGEQERLKGALRLIEEILEIILSSNEYDAVEEALNITARFRLAQGDVDRAYELTQELARLLDYVPAHPATQDYAYTHAQVLQALDRDEEAEAYLKRAYDWIMLVADNTENEDWRRSWLERARRNKEILTAAVEHGIA